jgi:CBS domain-containing protein
MTDEVAVVEPNARVEDAAEVMKNLDVGAVPVCEGRRPIGIVTDRDIALRSVAGEKETSSEVSEIMSNDMVFGTPDMETDEAAQIMASNQIRRLPIVDNEELVGMVALGDMAVNDKLDQEAAEALSSISYSDEEKEESANPRSTNEVPRRDKNQNK